MGNALSLLQLAGLWLRGRILRDRASKWDHQYATGQWEKLRVPGEQARFDATARLLIRQGPPGQVLEIGCGEALLQQRLGSADYLDWVGIDISEVAIKRAQAFATDHVRYHVADMELFDPGGRFDVIVFTESIYYSKDPRRLLERYVRFLKPTGCFIVSICRTKRSARIWAGLHTVAAPIDSISTSSELGTWDCEVLVPTQAPEAGLIPAASSAPTGEREPTSAAASDLIARLFAFSTPEGYEDQQGFHFTPLHSHLASASQAPGSG